MDHTEAFKKARSIVDKTELAIFLDYLSNKTDEPEQYKDIFEYYLTHSNPDVKAACIVALMTHLCINNQRYNEVAIYHIENITDSDLEYDLRLACITGLSDIYFNSGDLTITRLLYKHFIDEEEESSIRATCFRAILKVYFGMAYEQIFLKNNGKLMLDLEALDKIAFESELKKINELFST